MIRSKKLDFTWNAALSLFFLVLNMYFHQVKIVQPTPNIEPNIVHNWMFYFFQLHKQIYRRPISCTAATATNSQNDTDDLL